jgi:hypothetical protein
MHPPLVIHQTYDNTLAFTTANKLDATAVHVDKVHVVGARLCRNN